MVIHDLFLESAIELFGMGVYVRGAEIGLVFSPKTRLQVPRRRLDSQIESGGKVSPSEPTADAVHVAPSSRRERARHPRP